MKDEQGAPDESSVNGENGWIHVGESQFRLFASDTITARARGTFTQDEARTVFKTMLSWPRPENGFFYLSNVTHLVHQSQQVTSEAKKLPRRFFRAVAIVGASFRHRVLIETMLRASRYFKIDIVPAPTRYFETEEQAFEWFERIRRGEE
ncbi:MAG TPA: STAS/SEC14 domain-containing protein [Polyangium sp.]|nr:STAS/SEC14 domain-containing protein [Polyangium sp.]